MDFLLSFFTFSDNVLIQTLLAFPILLSMVISYRYLRVPDVTMDGSSILAAAVCIVLIRQFNVSWPVGLLGAILTGFTAGLITGVLIEVFKINSLLAGILNAFLLYSIGLLLIGAALDFEKGSTVFSLLKEKDMLLSWSFPSQLIIHPFVLLFLTFLVIILKLSLDWFLRREWSVVLKGTSTNEFFLQLRGVNTKRIRIIAFGIANALVGFGATLLSMYDGSVQIMRWSGTIIFALSVAIIGWEASRQIHRFLKIKLNDSSAIILGGLIYYTIVRICYTIDIPTALPKFLIALYIIIVLAEKHGMWRRLREVFK